MESTFDDYHGVKVADPYRWLENSCSSSTKAWISAQSRLTENYLNRLPQRATIRGRLKDLWNFESRGIPIKRGEHYFFTKNSDGAVYRTRSLIDTPSLVLDAKCPSADGVLSLADFVVSGDGRFIAYGLSRAGSDWETWRVRDLQSGQDLDDQLKWVKFSHPAWRRDGQGFFYSRYDEPRNSSNLASLSLCQKVYYHHLRSPQSSDLLICESRSRSDLGFEGEVTEDGRYLVITVTRGTDDRSAVSYMSLEEKGAGVVELLKEFNAMYSFVGNDGAVFWFLSDLDAPRRRLIGIDVRLPDSLHWKSLVPENEDTLERVTIVNEYFICNYVRDAHSLVRIHRKDGSFDTEITLPGIGTSKGFQGSRRDPETFYSFTSFLSPNSIYRLDLASGQQTTFYEPQTTFQRADFTTQLVFYRSKDGTRIPMYITHRRGMKRDGACPVYLYGYGAYGKCLTPEFSVPIIAWLEMGGIYAQPSLRGGGEYGEDWHQAGMRRKKQNTIDDFIAAAEWLIENDYTCPGKLAIAGASSGGMLVGACMVQRPDLYGAVLPTAGTLDMLRFHKFTIGWAWTLEYGSPDNVDDFKVIYSYSPLHNLKSGISYPAVLVTVSENDDRVVPAHSYKFAARLQACQAGQSPCLIRVETLSGHGALKSVSCRIDEWTDKLAFLSNELGLSQTVNRN